MTKQSNNPILDKLIKTRYVFINQFEFTSIDDLKTLADSIWEDHHREFSHQEIITFLNTIKLIPDDDYIDDKEIEIDFEEYLLENHIVLETVVADTDAHKDHQADTFRGDLSAECPHCKDITGYVSTGGHSNHGEDTVTCSNCGNFFKIIW